MKYLTLIVLLIISFQAGFSQLEVSGLVKDENGVLAYATVSLKDTIQQVKAFDITDDKGVFSMRAEIGKYTIEVSMLGYQSWVQEITVDQQQRVPDIILESATQQLSEVVVKHKVPLIERKPDRLIFNVASSVAASGGDALDALRAAPGLQVGTSAINMIGRGASGVMLNGRLLQLSGEELINFLNGISADDIQKIEIISNPPAKYEASGGGGLINIIYKKGIRESWKNSATLSYNKNTYNFLNWRNNFLYNKSKFRLNLSLNGNEGHRKELIKTKTNFPNSIWDQKENRKRQLKNISARVALDYDLSSNTSIGIQYLGNFNQPDQEISSITNIFNHSNSLDSILDNSGGNDRRIITQAYNMHLVSALDTMGRTLSFDFDYFDYDNKTERNYIVHTLTPNQEIINVNQAALNFLNQGIRNFSAKVDMEHPSPLVNLSYGAKLSFSTTLNDIQSYNTISGSPVYDSTISNVFAYREDVQALYISGSKSINDKLQMQFGLRLENTETSSFSKTINETNKNKYLKWFPSFYVSYQKDPNNALSFNYGRRINRPSFSALNPFRHFYNSNSYSEGNPFLQPSFSDNFNFSYAYKQRLTTVLFFNAVSDGFGTIVLSDGEDNTQAIVNRNYINDYSGGIGQIYAADIRPWWFTQTQFYLIGFDAKFTETLHAEPTFSLEYYINTSNTFTLSESSRIQLDFFYTSKHRYSLYDYSAAYGLDIGFRQQFFARKLQLSLLMHDVFDTGSLNSAVSEINGVKVDFGSNFSRRFLRLSLTYDFGNDNIRVNNRNFGNDEERRRSN